MSEVEADKTKVDEDLTDSQGQAEQEDDGLIYLEPEEVTITYPGFKEPKTEEQIHYEIATLDVLVKTLEARKAKLERNWTHHKLNVFLNRDNELGDATTGETPQ